MNAYTWRVCTIHSRMYLTALKLRALQQKRLEIGAIFKSELEEE